jgi:Ca2+-binding EF-hand superfamily protein
MSTTSSKLLQPNDCRQQLKQFLNLMQVQFTESELAVLCSVIDPQEKGSPLSRDDLIRCFAPEEELKRKNDRQLKEALKYLSGGKQTIEISALRDLLKNYSKWPDLTETVLNELKGCANPQGEIDLNDVLALLT